MTDADSPDDAQPDARPDARPGAGDERAQDPSPQEAAAPTGGLRREVLLVPLPEARAGAELAAYLEVPAVAVPARPGVLVVPRSGQVEQNLAVRASRLLRRSEVLVLRLADERVGVERWRGGRMVDEPPFGALGDLGDDAERVLLGGAAGDVPGAVASEDVDRRAFARTAVTAARGPVRTWQVVLQAGLALFAGFLALTYVLEAVTGGVQGAGEWFRLVLWPLLALFWLVALRGLLRRRAAERRGTAAGLPPGAQPPGEGAGGPP